MAGRHQSNQVVSLREPGTATSPWSADRSLARAAVVWTGVITPLK